MRGAVIGLGMMGRHHARILQNHPAMVFAGAVDPAGDRHDVVGDAAAVHPSIDALLAAGPAPDFAVIAYPCLVISFIAEVSLALWLAIKAVNPRLSVNPE